MADATSSIFNKKATEKLRSPDDLDKYVRVTSPSVWVAIAACIALLAGFLAWGLFGTVSTNVVGTGAVIEADDSGTLKPMCFLSALDAEKVSVGDSAEFGDVDMTVADVSSAPMSVGEARQLLGSDYLANALVNGDWAYAITFDGDTSQLALNVPISVDIAVERVPPITLIFRDRE